MDFMGVILMSDEINLKKNFTFECQQTADPPCYKCCTGRIFNIYFKDIENWVKDKTIIKIYSYMSIVIDNNIPVMRFKFKEDGTCPMLIEKQCMIGNSKPLNCQSIPLGFDGNDFYIQYKECEGLNKGEMTKEKLNNIQDKAIKDQKAKSLTARALPFVKDLAAMYTIQMMANKSE